MAYAFFTRLARNERIMKMFCLSVRIFVSKTNEKISIKLSTLLLHLQLMFTFLFL